MLKHNNLIKNVKNFNDIFNPHNDFWQPLTAVFSAVLIILRQWDEVPAFRNTDLQEQQTGN